MAIGQGTHHLHFPCFELFEHHILKCLLVECLGKSQRTKLLIFSSIATSEITFEWPKLDSVGLFSKTDACQLSYLLSTIASPLEYIWPRVFL